VSAPRTDSPDPIRALADACAAAALDKKATDVVLLDVRGLTSIADWFVLASGRSDTQVRAIAESVEEACRSLERRPLCVEGLRHGQWVLLDYGDVVVHVFHDATREYYDIERLYLDVPAVEWRAGAAG